MKTFYMKIYEDEMKILSSWSSSLIGESGNSSSLCFWMCGRLTGVEARRLVAFLGLARLDISWLYPEIRIEWLWLSVCVLCLIYSVFSVSVLSDISIWLSGKLLAGLDWLEIRKGPVLILEGPVEFRKGPVLNFTVFDFTFNVWTLLNLLLLFLGCAIGLELCGSCWSPGPMLPEPFCIVKWVINGLVKSNMLWTR